MSHALANTPDSPSFPAVVQAERLVDLAAIYEPAVQLIRLPRPANPAIADYLGAIAPRLGQGWRRVLAAGEGHPTDGYPTACGHAAGRAALLADVDHLAEVYRELIGCESLGLRLECLDSAMCPRFHVDRVGLRLLVTYRGPATEWLDDRAAERHRLGAGNGGLPDEVSGLIRDHAAVGQAEPFDLVLLKGAAWPGNESRGAIHRSPGVPAGAGARVLLAIDAVW